MAEIYGFGVGIVMPMALAGARGESNKLLYRRMALILQRL